MKFLLVVPAVLFLAGCSFALAPGQTARSGDDDAFLGEEPIAESALSEISLESVLALPGILSPDSTAGTPESTILSNNAQTVNPLPPTSPPRANLNGGSIQGSTPTTSFPSTLPTTSTGPSVPSVGTVGPGSGAGRVSGIGPSL